MHCIDDKSNGVLLNHVADWSGNMRIAWYIASERRDPGPLPPSLRECWCSAPDLIAGHFTPTKGPINELPSSEPPVTVLTRAVALAVEGYLRFRLERALDNFFSTGGVPMTQIEQRTMQRFFAKLQVIRTELSDLKKTYNGSVSLQRQSLNDQCDLLEEILDVPRSHPRGSQEDR